MSPQAAQRAAASRKAKRSPARPRLIEVASKAKVAVSTASAILSNSRYCYASATTRQRVMEAAETLGYRPNIMARGLRGSRARCIGLVAPGVTGPRISVEWYDSLERLAWDNGYQLIMAAHENNAQRQRAAIQELLGWFVDGFILKSPYKLSRDLLCELVSADTPLVTIDDPVAVSDHDVTVDRESGGYLQVRHLLEIGRRRIAFLITNAHGTATRAKMRGHRRALMEAGVDCDSQMVLTADVRFPAYAAAGRKLARQLLDKRCDFDAVVVVSDEVGLGVMRELLAAGVKIPDDAALIGFDDEPYTADLVIPMSTIRHPRELSSATMQLLLDLLDSSAGQERKKPQHLVLKPTLIVRESTAGGSCEGQSGQF